MLEKLLSLPGFVYDVAGSWYYLGKWICKKCDLTDASDCAVMFQMCRTSGEPLEASFYFQKVRAYSDFALEIPYDPKKICAELSLLLDGLTDAEKKHLEHQIALVESEQTGL